MKGHLLRLFLFFLVFQTSCRQKEAPGSGPVTPSPGTSDSTFTNPLLNAGPDPWVIRRDGWYYYCHTVGSEIRLWKVRRMSDLNTTESKVVWRPGADPANARNIWAPELHYLDGRWYLYFTAGTGDNATQRTWVLENASADPLQGNWIFKGKLATADDHWAIDATVLDFQGRRYALWSGWEGTANVQQNLYIARLTNPWTLDGPRIRISSPDFDWERNGSPTVNEAPQVLQKYGRVYLVYSASGCWTDDYCLGLLTLPAGADPLEAKAWRKRPQPVFTKSAASRAFGPGHCSFFQSPDGRQDWLLYHANPQAGQGCGDHRSPRAQPFSWGADSLPQFGVPVAVGQAVRRPSGE